MGTYKTHHIKMKVLSALLLCAGLASGEWTCEECEEGAHALGDYTTSPEAIQGQVDILIGVICPGAPDPDFCMENFPSFWGALSSVIFEEFWHHMCDDIEECTDHTHPPPPLNGVPKVSVPECGECFGRIAQAQVALGTPQAQAEIMDSSDRLTSAEPMCRILQTWRCALRVLRLWCLRLSLSSLQLHRIGLKSSALMSGDAKTLVICMQPIKTKIKSQFARRKKKKKKNTNPPKKKKKKKKKKK